MYRTKNENFFKEWNREMAYVLGFFAADGSMYRTKRGTHFIEFQITDRNLLYEIRKILGSNHKISIRNRGEGYKTIYRLQIGSKGIFNDLSAHGFTQNKSKIMRLPALLPQKYLAHFIRGYFDGDGNVHFGIYMRKVRKTQTQSFTTRFTSGS